MGIEIEVQELLPIAQAYGVRRRKKTAYRENRYTLFRDVNTAVLSLEQQSPTFAQLIRDVRSREWQVVPKSEYAKIASDFQVEKKELEQKLGDKANASPLYKFLHELSSPFTLHNIHSVSKIRMRYVQILSY